MTNIEFIRNFWNLFSEQKWEEAMAILHLGLKSIGPNLTQPLIGEGNG